MSRSCNLMNCYCWCYYCMVYCCINTICVRLFFLDFECCVHLRWKVGFPWPALNCLYGHEGHPADNGFELSACVALMILVGVSWAISAQKFHVLLFTTDTDGDLDAYHGLNTQRLRNAYYHCYHRWWSVQHRLLSSLTQAKRGVWFKWPERYGACMGGSWTGWPSRS